MAAVNGGTTYNFGPRYGPEGFATLGEVLEQDKTVWQTFGGASYSTIANTIGQASGFFRGMMSALRGDGKFQISTEDVVDMFKEASIVNSISSSAAALYTGKWLSKKGAYVSDATPKDVLLRVLTGLRDQKESDVYLKILTLKERKEFENVLQANFVKEFQRGVQAFDNKDPEQGHKFFKRAFVYINDQWFPAEKRDAAVALAAKDNGTLIQRIDWSYYMKDVPDAKKPVMLEAFKRNLQLQGR